MMEKRVVIATPYRGELNRNIRYAIACMKDCLVRGEAPLAPHLLYPFMLNDSIPEERALGMEAGHTWLTAADRLIVYTDLGISSGMQEDINIAQQYCISITRRKLPKEIMDGLSLDTPPDTEIHRAHARKRQASSL